MENGKPVILTIDDDPDVLESLKTILVAHGFTVVQAATAEEGLRVVRVQKPDLIIVDLMMEEVDAGTNFVKEFKVLGGGAPIYLLSSLGDSLNANTDYRQLGLAGVLQKPVAPETLLKLVRAQLKMK